MRRAWRTAAVVGLASAACAAPAARPTVAPTPATIAGLPPAETAGRGFALPFVEHEAENAVTNGTVLGPDRTFTSLAAEASGRRAVRLARRGDFVEFTLATPANAVTVRAAVPDGADGRGRDFTLSVVAGGRRLGRLATTSRYGWFYGAYPFSNRPADGKAHHFFDESRLHFGRTLPAGTRVRLTVGRGDRAPWYAVDLADFELVPPPGSAPAGALSIVGFGADPAGRRDSRPALRAAIAAGRARNQPVWIPPGRFRIDGHVEVDRVAIVGAGPWHSVLHGTGIGLYGRAAPHGSLRVTLKDFALIGEVTDRVDDAQLAGIGGAIGGGSLIENLWIQHHKVGLWFDGPMDGIVIRGLRILDNSADGLNLRRGVSRAVVENSLVRNSGDDGLAMWSHRDADHDNAFRNNIVVAPILANGIAVYGGRDIEISGNIVADTLTQGGGLHVGNRFDAVPVAGRIAIRDNLLVRAGSFDPNWRVGVGALWLYALDQQIDAAIEVNGLDIVDATLPAIHLIGKPIRGLRVDGVRIRGAGGAALQLQAAGEGRFGNVVAERLGRGGVLDCSGGAFRIADGGGNRGWSESRRGSCASAE